MDKGQEKEDNRSIRAGERNKINAIWLEATECSGNTISLLVAADPDAVYFLRDRKISQDYLEAI